ncbi:unnamed protein product [Allacma fusca]|uniref:Chromo domain-containing protein n=1 Tax=Allacma fusca TaxID=39272 RepID=A0A8J2K573_9HEXA|nr:unnamed protein product [Allacma fusca]
MPRPKRVKGGRPPKVKREWAVEKVMAKRYVSGSVEYFVKWVGYSSSQNTWEPPENLQKCQNIIDDYEEALLRLNRENGTGDSMRESTSLPLLDSYEPVSVPRNENAFEETVEDEEPPVEFRKEIVEKGHRPARAFHNFRYDEEAEDLFYIIEWADGDECEEIPGSVAREKYPMLLIQFLSQNYARTVQRRSFQNGHGSSFRV